MTVIVERAAIERFDALIGTRYIGSAPAAVLRLIGHGRPPHLPSGVPFAQSAYSIPSHVWVGGLPKARARSFVRRYDRRASYLAAWRGCVLPDGDWVPLTGPFPLASAAADAPGYFHVDTAPLGPYLAAHGLYDPFTRLGGGDPAWLTQPLAQLAGELADDAGIQLVVDRAVIAQAARRPFDSVADRLADARKMLDGTTDPVERRVLDLVRDAYVRGTAHLEYGKTPGHPLYRPEWRHTIIDRHVANMFRSLRRVVIRRPIFVGLVDSVGYVVRDAQDHPEGLAMGPELGSWQAGPLIPTRKVKAILDAGATGELIGIDFVGALTDALPK